MHDSGEIQMALPEYFNWRSQDLPKRYRDAGMFSWWKTSSTGQQSRGIVIPKTESVDIDTPEDLLLAQALFEFHAARRENP
jgi:CMP-N-acetylneuraminic acid synthetase